MRPNRTPSTLLAALLAAMLAGCGERIAPPGADGPESPEEAPRDGPEVPDPKGSAPLEAGAGGGTRFTVTRSDVRDSGDPPGNPLADGEGGYYCDGVEDCWEKCPPPEKDGTSTLCSCQWVAKGRAFCTVRTISNDGGGVDGGGGCGDGVDEEDPLASCPGPNFTVRLSCNPAFVTRGRYVSCTAYPSHNKGEVSYSWTFDPGAGAEIRNGGPPEILPEVRLDDVRSATWAGTGVHGGTVKVAAADDSSAFPAYGTDRFAVDDRGWKIKKFLLKPGGDLTNYLWPDTILGMNANANGSASTADVAEGAALVSAVAEGPNKGYGYVKSQSYYFARYWHVNKRLRADGPEEVPDTDGDVSHWDYMKRRGKNPGFLLAGTSAHETYGQNGMKGHQTQLKKALTLDACGDVSAIADRIVADNRTRAERLRSIAEGAADSAFWMASGHHEVYGNHVRGGTGSPVVWWKPGKSPNLTVHIDWKRTDPFWWTPGCDWASF